MLFMWDRLQPGRRRRPYRKMDGVHTGLFPAKASPTNRPRSDSRKSTAIQQWDRLQPGRRRRPYRKMDGVHTSLFPAKASPTNQPRSDSRKSTAIQQWDRLYPVSDPERLKSHHICTFDTYCSPTATAYGSTPNASNPIRSYKSWAPRLPSVTVNWTSNSCGRLRA